MDMGALLTSQFPTLAHRADDVRAGGFVTRMRAGGRILLEELGLDASLELATTAPSDTLRGWAAMAVGAAPAIDLADRLRLLRAAADDKHFAVREWAWLSVRPHICSDPRRAIRMLTPWTNEASDRLRRFAVEATRPRGVWCAHIPLLKVAPHLGLPLIEPLRGDPSRYVQNAVANWMNDASKSQAGWVRSTCAAWLAGSEAPETRRVCRRALRTVGPSTGRAPGSSIVDLLSAPSSSGSC